MICHAARKLLAPLLLLALAACSQYSAVEAKRVVIGGAYSVDPQRVWSKSTEGKTEIWTVHGPLLQAVVFFKNIEDGDTLYEPRNSDEDLPEFDSGMRANEVMEFVVDSMTRRGSQNVEATNLRPAKFGSQKGFRSDLNYQNDDGLFMQAIVCGAVMGGKLQLILYKGAKSYYFPRYQQEVEAILRSIQITSA